MSGNFDWCRAQFPALAREEAGRPVVFLDGPAGSQVPLSVADAVRDYLLTTNANCHGRFSTSRESDRLLEESHRAAADLVGTEDAETIVFGANMTSLTFALSRALARTWSTGDEVVVTRLDHDANVWPWVLAARDAGVQVRHVAIDPSDCRLDMEDFEAQLGPRTRLVAVGCASNAVGTINPIAELVARAHAHGAEVFLDAVHYAPHAMPDVTGWDCDWLVASAYKFFGPHIGILWGRRERLEELEAYKVRPAPDASPGKWMTGTQNHEGIVGARAAIDYLAELGRRERPDAVDRRAALVAAYDAIGRHERLLSERLLAGLAELTKVRIWGITDLDRIDERVPTFSITHGLLAPAALADYLAARGIFVWNGNFYALPLTEALGLEPEGMVRLGALHYNTMEEIERLLAALAELE